MGCFALAHVIRSDRHRGADSRPTGLEASTYILTYLLHTYTPIPMYADVTCLESGKYLEAGGHSKSDQAYFIHRRKRRERTPCLSAKRRFNLLSRCTQAIVTPLTFSSGTSFSTFSHVRIFAFSALDTRVRHIASFALFHTYINKSFPPGRKKS